VQVYYQIRTINKAKNPVIGLIKPWPLASMFSSQR